MPWRSIIFRLHLGARPTNAERAPSRRAARAVIALIIGVFAGEAGLLGACSPFSDTLLGYEGYTSWSGNNHTPANVIEHLKRLVYSLRADWTSSATARSAT